MYWDFHFIREKSLIKNKTSSLFCPLENRNHLSVSLKKGNCLLCNLIVKSEMLFLTIIAMGPPHRKGEKVLWRVDSVWHKAQGSRKLLIILNQKVLILVSQQTLREKVLSADLDECWNKAFSFFSPEIRVWGKPCQTISAGDISYNYLWKFQSLFWNWYLRLSSPLFFLWAFKWDILGGDALGRK